MMQANVYCRLHAIFRHVLSTVNLTAFESPIWCIVYKHAVCNIHIYTASILSVHYIELLILCRSALYRTHTIINTKCDSPLLWVEMLEASLAGEEKVEKGLGLVGVPLEVAKPQ